VTMNFSWTHASPRDQIVLTSPLGQAFAELEGDASVPHAEMRAADGKRADAADWSTLMAKTLGLPLPVSGLVWWTRGEPRAGAPHTMQSDPLGRTGVLRQDGCEIAYGYADDSARRPSRLNLTCRDLEMRIVIDRWRAS
jgi:outer membrane lipoprotein LolB